MRERCASGTTHRNNLTQNLSLHQRPVSWHWAAPAGPAWVPMAAGLRCCASGRLPCPICNPATVVLKPTGVIFHASAALAKKITPVVFKTTVAGLQIGHGNLPLAQQRNPAAIGTQAGPAGAAQCQDTGRWCNDRFCVRLFRCVVPEAQRSLIRPGQPVMARKKLHPLLTET